MSIVPNPIAEAEARARTEAQARKPWWKRRLVVELGSVIAAIAIALLLAAAWLYFRSRPRLDGSLNAAGLRAPVTIVRDQLGVVHITAQNRHDALFAEGYAMAQDRLFEMDLMRRRAEGELAELFGPQLLPADEAMRRLGLAAAAQAEFKRLPDSAGSALQAFSDGVNAYINSNLSRLPLEFTFLRYRPRPWTDADSLAITAYMYEVLTTNYRVKLAHARIEASLGPKLTRQLYPERSALDVLPGRLPGHSAPEKSAAKNHRAVRRVRRTAAAALPWQRRRSARFIPAAWQRAARLPRHNLPAAAAGSAPELPRRHALGPLAATAAAAAAASNNWVLGPARSLNGKPILANDPHLPYQIPGIWWTVELRVVPPPPASAAPAPAPAQAAPSAPAKSPTPPRKSARKPAAKPEHKIRHSGRTAAGAHSAAAPRRSRHSHRPVKARRGYVPFQVVSNSKPSAPLQPLAVAGVALAGVPGVVIGHNNQIAWGVTNALANVQQLTRYPIRLPLPAPAAPAAPAASQHRHQPPPRAPSAVPLSPAQLRALGHGVLAPGLAKAIDNSDVPEIETASGWQPVEIRWETIAVHGQAPVHYPVFLTPAGPVVGALQGQVVALDWTMYHSGALNAIDAFLGIDQASNWKEFERALQLFPGPAQNFVYADRHGNIGYQCAGWIPRSASFWRIQDGRRPAPALDAGGWLPFNQLPSVYNPASGVIVTANGRIAAGQPARRLTREWESPFRTHRILQLLLARPRWHAAQMSAVQLDVHSRPDAEMAAAILAAARRRQAAGASFSPAVATALASLRRWHGDMRARRDAPTLAVRTTRALMRTVLTARLGARLAAQYRWMEWPLVWRRWLRQSPRAWLPPSYAASAAQNPQAAWDALLLAVFQQQAAAFAAHRRAWQWGRRHPLAVPHPFYSHFWLLRARADLGPRRMPGGRWTVRSNTGRFGQSMRFVANLADWDRSTLTLPAGEAGEPLRRHYRDQFPAWLRGGPPAPLWFSPAAVQLHARHTLTLAPY